MFDQLYEFYYNRYYCKSMKTFHYPVFYKLDYSRYKSFAKYVKRNIPLNEFQSMEIFFSAYKEKESVGATVHTLNRDEEEICEELERTLAVMEMNYRNPKREEIFTEDTQEQTEES